MSLELRASVFATQGKRAETKNLFGEAAQQEKALGYREPPSYIRPVGETEATAMLAIEDWAEAKAAYEEALKERPRSGFALYGIAMVSEKSGKTDAAAKEFVDFLSAWKRADPTLAQVIHAQHYLAEHSATSAAARQIGEKKRTAGTSEGNLR
jgi:tetratricopeptide (TPR) repeat protein